MFFIDLLVIFYASFLLPAYHIYMVFFTVLSFGHVGSSHLSCGMFLGFLIFRERIVFAVKPPQRAAFVRIPWKNRSRLALSTTRSENRNHSAAVGSADHVLIHWRRCAGSTYTGKE